MNMNKFRIVNFKMSMKWAIFWKEIMHQKVNQEE